VIAAPSGAGRVGGSAASPFDAHRDDYDDVLNRGLSVSGENAAYFARRRIEWLAGRLREIGKRPSSVLDYGCGHGSSAPLFLEILGAERVLGVEKSSGLLEAARARHADDRIRFVAREVRPRPQPSRFGAPYVRSSNPASDEPDPARTAVVPERT